MSKGMLLLICILFYLHAVSTFVVNIEPKTAVVRVGDRQELRCSVAGCADDLPSAMFWGSLGDQPMEAEVTSNRTHSVATFKSVMPRHDGTLLCKATCGAQSKQSQAVLLVYSFPEAPVVTGHEHMVVDEEVTLTCTAQVNPPQAAFVEWLQGNQLLQRGETGLSPLQSTYRFTPRRPLKPWLDTQLYNNPCHDPNPEPSSNPNPSPDPADPRSDPISNSNLSPNPRPYPNNDRSSDPRSNPNPNPNINPNPKPSPNPRPYPRPDPSLTCRVTLQLAGLPAEGQLATKETSVPLRPLYIPEIISISPAICVSTGSRIKLVCLADGQPPPFITWSFTNPEGELVVVGDQKELVLSDVTAQQGGIYHCLAENPLGGNKKHVRVTIEAPPRNTSILVVPGEEVEEGQELSISCRSEVAGQSVMVLSRVNQGEDVELHSSENAVSVFFFLEAKLEHSGLYQCESSNQYGSEKVNTFITVKAAPRNASISVYPSMEVQEGQNVTISCQSVSYPPPAVILTNLVTGVERYSPDGLFLLVNVSANDSGLYWVNVTNELGYQTLNFTINVLVAPRNASISVYPSMEVLEGQNVTISCQSVSYPPPAVILTNLVTDVERYSPDGLFLLVNVSANDSGLYRVNFTNDLGYQTLNFTINVLGRSRAPPTDMVAVFAPVVCVAVAIAVTTTLLVSWRRSLRKGFYQLTKAPPPPPPPLS